MRTSATGFIFKRGAMNDLLDSAWEMIAAGMDGAVVFVDSLFSPLEIFGPAPVIFLLAFLVVVVTRTMARFYVTKRHLRLEKEFHYWQGIREEAMKHPDREKGKTLAKNIDQAKLNRAYYDYFFEGLLKHFIVNVLPILLTVSYVTRVYTPRNLSERFDKEWVFSFSFGASSPMHISSLLWFVVCLILSFVLFAVLKKVFKKRFAKNESDK